MIFKSLYIPLTSNRAEFKSSLSKHRSKKMSIPIA